MVWPTLSNFASPLDNHIVNWDNARAAVDWTMTSDDVDTESGVVAAAAVVVERPWR
jgi:hypothetical protein